MKTTKFGRASRLTENVELNYEQLTKGQLLKLCKVGDALADAIQTKLSENGFDEDFDAENRYEPDESEAAYTFFVSCSDRDAVGIGATVRLSYTSDGKLNIYADLDCGNATEVADYDKEGFQDIIDFIMNDITLWYEENEEYDDEDEEW